MEVFSISFRCLLLFNDKFKSFLYEIHDFYSMGSSGLVSSSIDSISVTGLIIGWIWVFGQDSVYGIGAWLLCNETV